MKKFKLILITILVILAFSTSAFAKSKMYVVDGTGVYKGYKLLKGYDEIDKFQVYFKGTKDSYNVSYIDNRNIDLNEIITWKYEGQEVKTKRKDLYNFFSNTSRYSSNLEVDDLGLLSESWFKKTFGKVYMDWLIGGEYSTRSTELVEEYFDQIDPTSGPSAGATLLPDSNVSVQYEWIYESDLEKQNIEFCIIPPSLAKDLGEYSSFKNEYASDGENIIYKVPDFNPNFTGIKTFNGIRMKYENGVLSFNAKDLKEKKIIK